MAKISVLCHPALTAFIGDICTRLEVNHSVLRCFNLEVDKIRYAIDRSDIIWVEWANEMLVWLTREHMLDGKRVIVRLHSYECFIEAPRQVIWPAVSDLVFVAPHVKDYFNKRWPFVRDACPMKQHVIPNGVDLERFPLIDRPIGKNLCFLGDISHKKDLPLLLQAFAYLLQETGENYQLHIGGAFQEERYGAYYDHIIPALGLERHVRYHGRVKNVPEFLSLMDYIVCSSPWEGHPVGIIEGMAMGLMPVIHNFPGAADLYGEKCLWADMVDFMGAVEYLATCFREGNRQYVIDRGWTLDAQVERIEKLIEPVKL